ncbi:MAG: cytochrome c biogenesis protein ResB [Bacteroidota bacterium]
MTNTPKKTWAFPWKYRESFLIAFALLVLGFAWKLALPSGLIVPPQWPVNIAIGGLYVLLLIFIAWKGSGKPLVKWLGSVPAAISSIALYSFMVLLMGFIPQAPSAEASVDFLGLDAITHHPAFLLLQIYLITSLGFVIGKRIRNPKENWPFLLNHIGLWVILFGAAMGAGDFKQYTMQLQEGTSVWWGYTQQGQTTEFPFAVKLQEFSVDYYAPKMAIIQADNGDVVTMGQELIEAGNITSIGNWTVKVDSFYRDAAPFGEIFYPHYDVGSTMAAYVSLQKNEKPPVSGWISSGSFRYQPQAIELNANRLLVMVPPEPQKFQSRVITYTKNGDIGEAVIEVNKPIKVAGYTLYQQGYDEEKGKWSTTSTLMVVRDPWLPFIYTGLYMLIAGALAMMYKGRLRHSVSEHLPKERKI